MWTVEDIPLHRRHHLIDEGHLQDREEENPRLVLEMVISLKDSFLSMRTIRNELNVNCK